MQYTCRINDYELHCTITSDRTLLAPVFCFSAMAPITVSVGGNEIYSLGSYCEIELPDLIVGQQHAFTLVYVDEFKPANRAWMPLGPYLRVSDSFI